MEDFFRYFLVCYIIVYLFLVVILRTGVVWYKLKKFPVSLDIKDDVRGLATKGLTIIFMILVFSVLLFCVAPDFYFYLGPIEYLDFTILKLLGILVAVGSLVLVTMAQSQMGGSWRMGIDDHEQTQLVTNNLFQYSRNPIYLGMMTTVLGLFLILPNAVTLLSLGVVFTLLQLQIRIEEEYLLKTHYLQFIGYMRNTRRWI